MKLKKGSAAAKAFMAKIRSAKGKTKKVVTGSGRVTKAKAKKKVSGTKLGSFQTTYNTAPLDVKKIIDNIDTSADYRLLIKAQKALSSKGYFIDYDLNGEIINFKKINNKLGAVKNTKEKIMNKHKDTKSHNVNIRVLSGTDSIDFTRVNNDVNGNPRYVVHFLDILNAEERLTIPFVKKYEYAIKKGKALGGKKYSNKSYGGGIVFQSYNIENLEKKLIDLKHTTPKIKY